MIVEVTPGMIKAGSSVAHETFLNATDAIPDLAILVTAIFQAMLKARDEELTNAYNAIQEERQGINRRLQDIAVEERTLSERMMHL